jgi:eukaryotic-like serine/threonine-protein kinase
VVGTGDVLAGKYKVEWVLGKGGMGYVVAARHQQLDQQVAIKILMPELCESDDSVARFLREGRAAASIQNEHVARVLDVGTLEDGAPYMVMEFLEGRDLAHELEDGTLPVTDAVGHVLQACEALAEAHALGIVHRDLKPANLFRARRPDGSALIKVLDFGISKALPTVGDGASLVHSTETQVLVGSPHYMSPEQVRSPKTVDARSDIWSLGITLFELLAGSPPFLSDNFMSILTAVVADEPMEIRSVREDVPIGLQDVILKCLEKKASARYANVVELAEALQAYAPDGAAAVSRISAIVRTAEDRLGAGHPRSRLANGTPAPERGAGRSKDVVTPTLESPRQIVEVLDSKRHASERWGQQGGPGGSRRWMALLTGGVVALGALFLNEHFAPWSLGQRSETQARNNLASTSQTIATDPPMAPGAAPGAVPAAVASSLSPEGSEGSGTSRDPDAAIGHAAALVPPFVTKEAFVGVGRRPILVGAKKSSPANAMTEQATTEGSLAPATSSLPGLPALETPLDPLEGRR